ncbi:hypothetical protein SAMN05421752_11567 [Natronorubrum thiooxidans]|uniref:Uncharacterized protein n=1 Tax=Natronorubrum thiooxidans TaxID=308853 RepID=A0A1N7GTP0_9EURY|nr:hypothetical protein SAMN05421752_11567 [Natronorubrum thiooxidans]
METGAHSLYPEKNELWMTRGIGERSTECETLIEIGNVVIAGQSFLKTVHPEEVPRKKLLATRHTTTVLELSFACAQRATSI